MDKYVKMVKDIRIYFKEHPEFEKECEEQAEEIINEWETKQSKGKNGV